MELIEHNFVPGVLKSLPVPREEMVIVPIGDVHYGSPGCAKDAFKRYLHAVETEFDKPYYIGMGEYLDAARTTTRKALQSLAVDDAAVFDEHVSKNVDGFAKLLEHTEGRWLGMLQGNHTWQFREGDTVESRLCHKLKAEFLGDCADIRIQYQRNDNKPRGAVGIWAHHGVGGRKYPVGKLLDDICPHFPDSDIFLMGHSHIREYRDYPRLHRGTVQYIERIGVAAITGGWLAGYRQGPSTYVERRALKPLALGSLVIKIRPRVVGGLFSPEIRVETI